MDNKFPGKDITDEDLRTKIPKVSDPSRDPIMTIAGTPFGGDLVPIMAGPNMVENEDLIVNTAIAVKKAGAHFLRGGAFKPLTFPYRSDNYTETREDGLRWLATAKREAGIAVITEVMEERFLDLACEVADVIQIGARNMQNYPLIIAAARTGKPLMIKRHFGCSLRDWLGAAEYAMVEGNDNIILCERGISAAHTHRATSRFLLDLQVVPAAREVTRLPVGVDPSHATFWAPWVKPMALASIASGADFIMLEVHPEPARAKVDPLQPINFTDFGRLMGAMNQVAKAIGRRVE
jgi:3-deoxy-7-phosphoheptulonate synthase